MTARIEPARPPFEADIGEIIDRTMKGQPALQLFATIARDPRLARKFFAGGLLDKGNLSLRPREIVIARTTALCGSEYEWGVHISAFAEKAGMAGFYRTVSYLTNALRLPLERSGARFPA